MQATDQSSNGFSTVVNQHNRTSLYWKKKLWVRPEKQEGFSGFTYRASQNSEQFL